MKSVEEIFLKRHINLEHIDPVYITKAEDYIKKYELSTKNTDNGRIVDFEDELWEDSYSKIQIIEALKKHKRVIWVKMISENSFELDVIPKYYMKE